MDRVLIERRIVAAMEAACRAPMRWGVDDCALWVADILRPALGFDPVAAFRGRYRTRLGAWRVLGRDGLLGRIRIVAKARQWRPIAPADALVGDLGLAPVRPAGGGGPVLAAVICRAPGWFVGRNEQGFTGLPAGQVAHAWRLPRRRSRRAAP
jgi:hypothetical protein